MANKKQVQFTQEIFLKLVENSYKEMESAKNTIDYYEERQKEKDDYDSASFTRATEEYEFYKAVYMQLLGIE